MERSSEPIAPMSTLKQRTGWRLSPRSLKAATTSRQFAILAAQAMPGSKRPWRLMISRSSLAKRNVSLHAGNSWRGNRVMLAHLTRLVETRESGRLTHHSSGTLEDL